MPADSSSEFPTIIGPDANFKGELSFEKGVKHLGRFEGTIHSKGHLMIAQGASLQGDVEAGSVEVEGDVKGNLHASGKVRLAETARLEGDLHTARLEVVEGAVFIGRCMVGPNGAAKSDKPVTPYVPDQRPPRTESKDREPVSAGGGKK